MAVSDDSFDSLMPNPAHTPPYHLSPFRPDEYPQLTINYEALYYVANSFLPREHGNVTHHTPLERGSFHEVCVLHFEDGWKAVARFKRNREQSLAYAQSELDTMAYVREHTALGERGLVPEVYFVNHNEAHVVGCAFAILEHMKGRELWSFVYEMGLEGKKSVVKQWAGIVVELAKCKFDKIGSLVGSKGQVGKVQDNRYGDNATGRGPFDTFEDYILDLMALYKTRDKTLKAVMAATKIEVCAFFAQHHPAVSAPFRLVHGDLKVQNLLFHYHPTHPVLSAIIDWDGTAAFPLYYLFEYPGFILDLSAPRALHADNKILRELFRAEILGAWREGMGVAVDALDKKLFLERVLEVFPWQQAETETQVEEVRAFLEEVRRAGG